MFPVWYGKDPAVDAHIRLAFQDDLTALRTGRLDSWRDQLLPCLAGIVLGDQLSRNAHRDSAEMYAADPIALAWCKGLIAEGSLNRLPLLMRSFATMPLVHSEDVQDLELMKEVHSRWLEEESSKGNPAAEFIRQGLVYTEAHARVLRKWGRYPHRNAILGRTSTPEEVAGLRDGTIQAW